jgi:polysaccharide biosynthesis/export protein
MTTAYFRNLMLVVPLMGCLSAAPARAAQGGAQTPAPPKDAGSKPAEKPGSKPGEAPKPAAPAPESKTAVPPPNVAAAAAAGVTPAPDYVIGSGDVLAIVFWREQEMSVEVVVRPDGRISIPLLNDVEAVGLTPEDLRQRLVTAAQRVVQDPNVTVVVKQINSRRVFITGQVGKPGPYPLLASMNVLQLISTAGGLLEYADEKNIVIMRTEKGQTTNFKFNYKDVAAGKNLKQNIELKTGDTVVVP